MKAATSAELVTLDVPQSPLRCTPKPSFASLRWETRRRWL